MILVGIVSLALLTVSEDGTEFVAKNAPKESQISLHRAASNDTPQEKKPSPIFATTTRDGSTLKLRPSFPLSPGENYELRLTVGDDIVERLAYQAPLPEKAPPEIVNILPGTEAVPANLLKFYLEFDQPMREGREIFDKIHLEDQHGKRVHSPWRRQELWANDNKRLTLWIHPGRIKQGVNLRNELGPVLVPGETYDLVLENSIQAASGQPLEKNKTPPLQNHRRKSKPSRSFTLENYAATISQGSSDRRNQNRPRSLSRFATSRNCSQKTDSKRQGRLGLHTDSIQIFFQNPTGRPEPTNSKPTNFSKTCPEIPSNARSTMTCHF